MHLDYDMRDQSTLTDSVCDHLHWWLTRCRQAPNVNPVYIADQLTVLTTDFLDRCGLTVLPLHREYMDNLIQSTVSYMLWLRDRRHNDVHRHAGPITIRPPPTLLLDPNLLMQAVVVRLRADATLRCTPMPTGPELEYWIRGIRPPNVPELTPTHDPWVPTPVKAPPPPWVIPAPVKVPPPGTFPVACPPKHPPAPTDMAQAVYAEETVTTTTTRIVKYGGK
jgi:hypothetical protein